MSLQNVGQNSAEEFFETMLYMTAYQEAQTQIKEFTSDIENDVLEEALQSAMNILTMGVIFMMIRKQEQFIQTIFDVASGLTTILLASGFAQKMAGKLGNLKGTKLFKKFSMMKSAYSDRVATAKLVVDNVQSHFVAEGTTQNESKTLETVNQMKEHVVSKEKLNHAVGSGMASRYNETLMFKLFTKSFTANDEQLIKKILGRSTGSELKIEDMNKVADFLFVTDNNGEITGLSEQMFQLINGLGYLHNK
jgi:hypothetical protein